MKPVKNSKRASPVVIMNKPKGNIRICIDPKRTLNPMLRDDHHPLPRIDDHLTEIGYFKLWSLIDLSGAFQQLPLANESQE